MLVKEMSDVNNMLKLVIDMKKDGKGFCYFDLGDRTEIFIEACPSVDEDGSAIAIEWRSIESYEVFEAAQCDPHNDSEIQSALEYVLRCALDGRINHEKTSLTEQIQSASFCAAELHSSSHVETKGPEPEI